MKCEPLLGDNSCLVIFSIQYNSSHRLDNPLTWAVVSDELFIQHTVLRLHFQSQIKLQSSSPELGDEDNLGKEKHTENKSHL